ncbi:I78 family peptidase inhibitor [Acidimangrovimonas sediminis]|uniref:I78 family peptidase inhibitor n=1 Tax=Acidimangrovimonas sediminis TaxID=2056283 RepID=UPI0011AEC40D|nr:I78 family peptidase inhibitor [Acidimangrovimonas sediminis]
MRLGIAGLGLGLGLVAMLAGCGGGGPVDMSDPAGTKVASGPVAPAMCGADRMGGVIGKKVAIVQAMSLPSPARIYQAGSPITQDFNAHRLNIEFDANRVITRAYCG